MTTTTRTRVPGGWWRTAAAYSAAVLLALVAGEAVVRLSTFEPTPWYPQITVKLGSTPVRYMFVGSSRVGAGVNVTNFANAQPAGPDGSPGSAFNNGRGFAAIVTHAIGLRNMSEAGLLRGATIFVEAAGGSPDEGTWRDRWYYREAPSFLLSVAGLRDLPGLWYSTMSVEEKLAASARTLLNGSTMAVYAEMIRVNGLSAAYRVASPQPTSAPRLDLREEGGVRGDVDDLPRVSRAAVVEGQRMLDEQRLVIDWDVTVAADIARVVRAGGGEVVFFEMPLSPPMQLAAASELGRRNGESFRQWAAVHGITVLRTRREFPIDMFPDVWHMSATAADVFTQDLIDAWTGRR